MSWVERGIVCALSLILALGLAGCQVRPLYADAPGAAGPQADLPAVSVESPGSRVEQVYRNALVFGLTGGGEAAGARYALTYRMTINTRGIVTERGTGTPNAYLLAGSVSFLLKDNASGESTFGANVTATDSYTRSSQDFSNIRGLRDAEDRIAKALAELTQARLAAFFATR